MGSPTYIPLANVTLTGSDGSITFASLPQIYSDLVIVVNGSPSDNSYPVIALRFNADSGSNYSYVGMSGNGSSAAQGSNASLTYCTIGQAFGTGPSTSSRFFCTAQIFGYRDSNHLKMVVSRNNVPETGVEAQTTRWASTSAITSIEVLTTSGGFASGTTLALYGIAG